MRADLHLHSHVSDGQLPPREVAIAALNGGLDVVALTDHDTAAGVAEFAAAAAGTRLRVIPGIEVSAVHGSHQIHLLGYHIDLAAPATLQHQRDSAERRVERMRGMVRRMQALGSPVTFEQVVAEAGEGTRSLGRPHLARALLKAGFIRFYGEAFDLYLRDGGPGFVESDFPGVAEAVKTIHAMGGVALWAHPDAELFDEFLAQFVAWGMDGVECYRPNHYPEQTIHYLDAARGMGLLVSGGSDWHSPYRGPLGDFAVDADFLGPLLDRAVRRAA